jgi:hypothetical protein
MIRDHVPLSKHCVLRQKDSSFLGYTHLYPGFFLQYKKQQEQELAQEEARELTGFHVCPCQFIFVYSGFEIQFLKIEHFHCFPAKCFCQWRGCPSV